MTIFILSVICMLMHGQANGTITVMLHHFGSFVCAVSPQQQPNWCLTAAILTANNSSSHTKCKCPWFIVTQSGRFIWHFCIISMICLQGNRIKGWKICREYVNRLELYFFLVPYYLIVHLYWMLCMIFFCINMYLKFYLCMPYAYIMQFAS